MKSRVTGNLPGDEESATQTFVAMIDQLKVQVAMGAAEALERGAHVGDIALDGLRKTRGWLNATRRSERFASVVIAAQLGLGAGRAGAGTLVPDKNRDKGRSAPVDPGTAGPGGPRAALGPLVCVDGRAFEGDDFDYEYGTTLDHSPHS